LVRASIRVTVPSPLFATHTEPAPIATPAGARPTAIVSVTDRVAGSIRATLSSSEYATHTPPSPTAIPVGPLPTGIGVSTPVGSTRVTLSPSVSVSQVAPAPSAIAAGPEFGSSGSTRPVAGSRRVSRPEDGATQTVEPCAATAAGPPGTRFPIRFVAPRWSNWGSIAFTSTLLACGLDCATQIAPAAAARPVGGPPTENVCSVRIDAGSIRETLWSSTFATHSDPEPSATAPGRLPVGAEPTTLSLRGSIAATEFGAT
jgi:hypothetical protein